MATTDIPEQREKLTPEELDRRAADIVALRRARTHFTEIGRKWGISDVMAGKIYRQAIANHPLTAIQVDEHRLEEVELADTATRQLMVIAMSTAVYPDSGNPVVTPRAKIEAWSSIRAWAEHKAKLLGLNAPTKIQLDSMSAIDAEIMKLQAQIDAEDAAERAAAEREG